MTEREIQHALNKRMSRYFEVFEEVCSNDKKSRIDIVMIHKTDIGRECPIGIEVKTGAKKTGNKIGAWLKQSSTYSEKDFINYGKLMICTYPQITGIYLREGTEMSQHDPEGSPNESLQNNVNTFLGSFKIGELQYYYRDSMKYYRIVFNGKLIWDEYRNIFKSKNYKRYGKNNDI